MTSQRVGLVGSGNLARALVLGFLAAGMPADRIWVTNRSDDGRLDVFRKLGCHAVRDKAELCGAAEILLLAFKPKDASGALQELRPHLTGGHLVISCLAGIPLAFIEGLLGTPSRVVRAMPNTASGVRASATAISPGSAATKADLQTARALLLSVGEAWIIPEEWMDAATAVAGSGPAYVYLFVEALADAAVASGLPPDIALAMVEQTVFGAIRLAQASPDSPSTLRAQVSSPGGTTVAAIEVLERERFCHAIREAVRAAIDRSRELGRLWSQ